MKKNIKKRLTIWVMFVAGILTIPYLTNAPWTQSDYIFAGAVLFTLSVIYEITTRNMKNVKSKLIVAAVLLGVIILILGWAATGPDSEALINQGK